MIASRSPLRRLTVNDPRSRCSFLDLGSWVQEPCSSILGPGSSLLAPRSSLLKSRSSILDPRSSILIPRSPIFVWIRPLGLLSVISRSLLGLLSVASALFSSGALSPRAFLRRVPDTISALSHPSLLSSLSSWLLLFFPPLPAKLTLLAWSCWHDRTPSSGVTVVAAVASAASLLMSQHGWFHLLPGERLGASLTSGTLLDACCAGSRSP